MKNSKGFIILGVVLVLIVITLSYCSSTRKKPVDWQPSFYNTHTKPYGTYICYKLLDDVFPNGKVKVTRRPIYNNLKDTMSNYFEYDDYQNNSYSYYEDYEDEHYDYDEDDYSEYNEEETDSDLESEIEKHVKTTNDADKDEGKLSELYNDIEIVDTTSYIFVNTNFTLDKLDLEYLLDFVGIGNNVFISSESINKRLLDTLGVELKSFYIVNDTIFSLVDYPNKNYTFKSIYSASSLDIANCTSPTRILAKNQKSEIVFVQIKYGNGYFYLHTIPTAFSNYHLLNLEKYDFAFRCLSYMPRNSSIIWDEYQKQGMIGEDSMFREVFASKQLTIAFILILFGFLLFMIFRAKRTQRIVPIINPPVNSSLEFLDTISNLYYHRRDFATIAQKRHAYFTEYIRKNYYLSTEVIDNEFLKNLSSKSGVPIEKLNELFEYYKDITYSYEVSNEMFLKYNSLLEDFYRTVENNKK